jgi:hypothetical protein
LPASKVKWPGGGGRKRSQRLFLNDVQSQILVIVCAHNANKPSKPSEQLMDVNNEQILQTDFAQFPAFERFHPLIIPRYSSRRDRESE